ncbi:MAG TPA: YjgP/YjgQ family permease, partial [Kiritimatiellae bacterium]|nr:YjgP/YjgQ family permease [Kiritimatiellia bacterium]
MPVDIISRYVSKDYLVTFATSLLVFTFVLCIGAVVKAIDLLARGVSGMVILKVFLSAVPYLLSFSIPISALTSALLVFTRRSLEGEISAMKACGLSIWQIAAAPLMLSIALSLGALFISGWVAPHSHFAKRKILQQVGVEEPAALLEEGRFVKDFPGFIIYVGHKEGRKITDIIVYEIGGKSRRNVRARRGVLRPDPTNRILYVDLYDVRIEQSEARHPLDLDRTRYITAEYYPVRLDFSALQKTSELRKKRADMTLAELIDAIRSPAVPDPDLRPRDILRRRVDFLIEAN